MKKLILEFYKELLEVLAKHDAIIDVAIEDGVYYTVAGVKHDGLTRYDEHFYKTKCAYETVAARIYALECEEERNEETTDSPSILRDVRELREMEAEAGMTPKEIVQKFSKEPNEKTNTD